MPAVWGLSAAHVRRLLSVSRALTAARELPCAVCFTPAGEACQAGPRADHLARYLGACADGRLAAADMAAVFRAAAPITRYRLVTVAELAAAVTR